MFQPTKSQLMAKSRFWRAVQENPMLGSVDDLPMSEVCRLAGTKQIVKWAQDNDEFRDWFKDPDNIKDRIQVGAEKAIDRLIDIISAAPESGRDALVTTSNQIAAAKMLLDFSGHKPADKQAIKVSADQLPDDEAALRKYIAKNAEKLKVIE
jgi:hypothetical protein